VQGGAGGPGVVDAGLGVDVIGAFVVVIGSRFFISVSVASMWHFEVSVWST